MYLEVEHGTRLLRCFWGFRVHVRECAQAALVCAFISHMEDDGVRVGLDGIVVGVRWREEHAR